jgi:hypothetical protein
MITLMGKKTSQIFIIFFLTLKFFPFPLLQINKRKTQMVSQSFNAIQVFDEINLNLNFLNHSMHFRLAEYLVGVLTGYIMHVTKTDNFNVQIKSKNFQVIFGWILSLGFIIFHVYFSASYWPQSLSILYIATFQVAWACSVCWIVFACHNLKSGGPVRVILSHHYWQPLSKLCLGFYILHYIYIIQSPFSIPKVPQMIHVSFGDVSINLIFAFLFYLAFEAPVSNLLTIFWEKKNIDKNKVMLC